MQNRYIVGSCGITQEALLSALEQPRGLGFGGMWESFQKEGPMCTYGWFMLYDRNQHKTVKQLSSN